MSVMFFSRTASSNGMFSFCALIVCEKKAYVLLGMSSSMGTVFTDMITSASERSLHEMAPADM